LLSEAKRRRMGLEALPLALKDWLEKRERVNMMMNVWAD
jgi:hypothetical protein